MSLLPVFLFLSGLVTAVLCQEKTSPPGGGGLFRKYENIDVEEVLKNERLYRKYIDCLLGKAKCVMQDAKDLREVLPDTIKTNCASCTEKQRERGRRAMKLVKSKHPADFEALLNLYDPTGEYRKKYPEF
uniref:Chemosensory protein 5 n=1 Tax=Yemma signatus TaxID=300820 RepID=A0A3G2GRR4_9HEMI|nr:chemosensory protein 5 [Yemma signatus]